MFPEKKHLKILLVDDEPSVRDILARILSLADFPRVTVASSGEEGRDLLLSGSPDLLVTDLEMPSFSGEDLLLMAREKGRSTETIIISGGLTDDRRTLLMDRGARACFRKPFLFAKLLAEIEQVYHEIAGELLPGEEEALSPLLGECEKADPYARGHNRRVADLAMETALAMDLSLRRLINVRLGGLCADIGKMRIDPRILGKETPLTGEEREMIKLHPIHSLELVDPLLESKDPLISVAEHHENVDGSGYPFGLSGDQIHLEAQIVSIADSFDAMGSPRPFRQAWDRDEIRGFIVEGRGTRWSPLVVDTFLSQQFPA